MIGQFDFSEKGWVEGKGRSAVWRDIPYDAKLIEPQYIMSYKDFVGKTDRKGNLKAKQGLKVGFLAVGSATNSRSMFAGLIINAPAGNAVPVLQTEEQAVSLVLMAVLNSYAYDYALRNRLGGLNLNYFVLAETVLTSHMSAEVRKRFSEIALSLGGPAEAFALPWVRLTSGERGWHSLWATTPHERLRLRCICEAVVAELMGLGKDDFAHVLADTDHPVEELTNEKTFTLNPKGFWRTDKGKEPELRQSVLSQIAFADLKEKGIDDFLKQNDGEGWMIPETLRLAEFGLGHDDRAQEYQPRGQSPGSALL